MAFIKKEHQKPSKYYLKEKLYNAGVLKAERMVETDYFVPVPYETVEVECLYHRIIYCQPPAC